MSTKAENDVTINVINTQLSQGKCLACGGDLGGRPVSHALTCVRARREVATLAGETSPEALKQAMAYVWELVVALGKNGANVEGGPDRDLWEMGRTSLREFGMKV